MAGGGMMKKGYKSGGKLEMVEKDGKMVPFYAADGKGKMAAGGAVEKRKKAKEDKKKTAKGDRGFQGRAAARELSKFKEKRGRIGGASRGATGGAMGGGGGMGVRLMDAIGAPRPRRMKEGGMADMLMKVKPRATTDKQKAKARAEEAREIFKTGKRKPKQVKPMKAGGMAKKGYASGGMMKKGYAGGGIANISKADMGNMLEGGKSMRATKKAREDAKRRAEDLRERIKTGKRKSNPATPMKAGGMAKKGYASGGMMKKGYASGGMAKKGYASGGRGSTRGDGIAIKGKTRGRMV